MTVLYRQEPQVISTSPNNHQNDVATTAKITVTFNTDLHRKYLTNVIKVFCFQTEASNDSGSLESIPVEGDLVYEDRVITFTPKAPMLPGMVYHATVVSDRENGVGIRNVLGDFMLTNYSFTFSTVMADTLPAVRLISPVGTIIKVPPVFDWQRVPNTKYYHLEVSKSNTFQNIFWEHPVDVSVSQPPLQPTVHFDPKIFEQDGIYYWRVQAHGWHGEIGDMSEIGQFNIDRTELSPVVPEDPFIPDIVEDTTINEVEILETYPEQGFSNVATNLQTILVRVRGDVDPTRFTRDTIKLIGQAVDDDPEATAHGEIAAPIQITKLPDGTTLIALMLKPVS